MSLCDITLIEAAWCSHCTGAKLPADEIWQAGRKVAQLRPPVPHTGQHGRSCNRCIASVDQARSNAQRLARWAKLLDGRHA